LGVAVAAAFAFCLVASAATAEPDDSARAYAVLSEVETASSVVATRETLALHSVDGEPLVTISNDVAMASFAATFASDGELSVDTSDAGIICYNMAAAVSSEYTQNPRKAVPLAVVFAGNLVPIQLSVRSEQDADNTRVLVASGQTSGTIGDGVAAVPAGVALNAKISQARGHLLDATFTETVLVGSPAQATSRTTCSLTQLKPRLEEPTSQPVA